MVTGPDKAKPNTPGAGSFLPAVLGFARFVLIDTSIPVDAEPNLRISAPLFREAAFHVSQGVPEGHELLR